MAMLDAVSTDGTQEAAAWSAAPLHPLKGTGPPPKGRTYKYIAPAEEHEAKVQGRRRFDESPVPNPESVPAQCDGARNPAVLLRSNECVHAAEQGRDSVCIVQ